MLKIRATLNTDTYVDKLNKSLRSARKKKSPLLCTTTETVRNNKDYEELLENDCHRNPGGRVYIGMGSDGTRVENSTGPFRKVKN